MEMTESSEAYERFELKNALTIYHVAEQRASLMEWDVGETQFELDLSAVTDCDCAGIQLLLALRKRLSAQGCELRLHEPREKLIETLNLLNVTELLSCVAPGGNA